MWLTTRTGRLLAIAAGALVGALMAILVWRGNPGHMGICGACFLRDIAGAVGLHRAAPVQYVRPEVVGVVLGALFAALAAREFRARGGASPLFKFLLGAWVSIGALVFLGCPFRMLQRLGGGDLNALVGAGGLVVGIGVALALVRTGTSAGRSSPAPAAVGLFLPLVLAGLLAALLLKPAGIAFSAKGPGSQHAPWLLSLGVGLAAGVAFQRVRFCTLGAFRNAVFYRDFHLMSALVALVVAYGVVSAATGRFHLGMENQPIAHTSTPWNFLSMILVGLAASLAGGCPVRQMVLAGEGDTDAVATILGMVVGGALAHNFNLASSAAGPTFSGKVAVGIGLLFCVAAALAMRGRRE
ncbi:MAG: YedE-related selenium metabolism membrane protein [Planctomycetes bacterium]|nr:YedE-related selenium metabolism membrane protein [Planctomycetota bacterium]